MTAIEESIKRRQVKDEGTIKTWQKKEKSIEWCDGRWKNKSAVVVSKPEEVQHDLLEWYHDAPTAGHPGIARTYLVLAKDFW